MNSGFGLLQDNEIDNARTIRVVVGEVLTEVASEELPLLEGMASLSDAAVSKRLRRSRRSPEPLGFGIAEVAALTMPVVWLVLEGAVQRFGETGADATARRFGVLRHRVFRRRRTDVEIPPLTREQLSEVRRLVLESSAARGIDDAHATAVADAVVRRLVLAPPE